VLVGSRVYDCASIIIGSVCGVYGAALCLRGSKEELCQSRRVEGFHVLPEQVQPELFSKPLNLRAS
jgi:hypothetical protein